MAVMTDIHYAALCDFCCEARPSWKYPCKDFDMLPLPWGSKGAFAACDECSVLIEADDRFTLASKAPDVRKAPLGPGRLVLLRMVRLMHDKFFNNRTGPREAISLRGPEAPTHLWFVPVTLHEATITAAERVVVPAA